MLNITPAPSMGAEFFLIRNENGAELTLTNLGATIVSIKMPDKDGEMTEVTLGYDDFGKYADNSDYLGCVAGRYANRIAGGVFELNDKEYKLSRNEGENTLHGGAEGISKKLFTARPLGEEVVFALLSPDGDQGFPGNLEIKVTYALSDDNKVIIEYDALSDKDTIINLTNHTYFNLNGGSRDILNNYVSINADKITQTDNCLIPTGEFLDVKGTPYDLRKAAQLSDYIPDPLKDGYDVNYVLNGRNAASVYSPDTGIKMEVRTDLPGVQFYTAGALSEQEGRGGAKFKRFYGLCLETQNFPDAIHHKEFPSCVLKAGETYRTSTEYKFTAQ